MAINSAPSGNNRTAARSVYSLGDALGRFRYYAELNYAGASDEVDFGGRAPVVPEIIEKCLGQVLDSAARVADALPDVSEDVQAIVASARSARARIAQVWLDTDHCSRIRSRYSAERADVACRSYFDWLVLSGSPLAPPAWTEYQAARTAFRRTSLRFIAPSSA